MQKNEINTLPEEKQNILFKLLVRWHKEHGSLNVFMEKRITKKEAFKNLSEIDIYNRLITLMWEPYKNTLYASKIVHNNGLHEDEELLASIAFITFVDLLFDTNDVDFEHIAKIIIKNEFDYINGIILDYESDGYVLGKNIINEINSSWYKYGGKIETRYKYLPFV